MPCAPSEIVLHTCCLEEYCSSLKELIVLKEKNKIFHTFFKEYHTLIKGPLHNIYTKELHLENWNDALMSEGILHPFQRDDALS